MRELCPSEGEVPCIYCSVRKALVFVFNWHCTAADLLSVRRHLSVQLKLWNLARAEVNTPCHHSTSAGTVSLQLMTWLGAWTRYNSIRAVKPLLGHLDTLTQCPIYCSPHCTAEIMDDNGWKSTQPCPHVGNEVYKASADHKSVLSRQGALDNRAINFT